VARAELVAEPAAALVWRLAPAQSAQGASFASKSRTFFLLRYLEGLRVLSQRRHPHYGAPG
jgi:hypothetical protein